mgnify:CR=1 FL=1
MSANTFILLLPFFLFPLGLFLVSRFARSEASGAQLRTFLARNLWLFLFVGFVIVVAQYSIHGKDLRSVLRWLGDSPESTAKADLVFHDSKLYQKMPGAFGTLVMFCLGTLLFAGGVLGLRYRRKGRT